MKPIAATYTTSLNITNRDTGVHLARGAANLSSVLEINDFLLIPANNL